MAAEHRKIAADRRDFLSQGAGWLKVMIWSSLLYPAGMFLRFVIPTKPRKIVINKVLANGAYLVQEDFILFDSADGPWAVSRRCTHLGCRLNYREDENLLVCPCHQSKFTITGKRVDGPARRDLPVYDVAKLSGKNNDSGYLLTL